MPVPEGPAGQPLRGPAGGRSGKWLMRTQGQRRNGGGVEQDAQTRVQLSAGMVLMSQNRASRRRGWSGRLEDNRWRESVLEETSRWPCPRSSRTGMSGAKERSGLEALKSHQHLDRSGSVGGVRPCWECAVVREEGQARPPTRKQAAPATSA